MSKYSVKLNQEQRKVLEDLVKKGEAPARKITHANILLKTDSGAQGPRWPLKKIQEAFGVGSTLVKMVRKRFVENGLEDAINRRSQPERLPCPDSPASSKPHEPADDPPQFQRKLFPELK